MQPTQAVFTGVRRTADAFVEALALATLAGLVLDPFRPGAAPLLVLSGGRTPGNPVSEPQAMRDICVAQGVPAAALVLDEQGQTTAATVACVAALARARGWRQVLAVSHDYHLARIRLLGQRAGLALRTVPARETRPQGWKVAAVAREALAWTVAWLG